MKSSTVYKIREVVNTLSTDADLTQKAVAEIEKAIIEDSKYNGWSNYETWLMSLNLDNEQPLNEMVMSISNSKDLDTYDKAQVLKERVEEMFYNDGLGVYKICDTWTERDFQEVDWCEIIESHLDESFEAEED